LGVGNGASKAFDLSPCACKEVKQNYSDWS
jgi:hypothetical protein